MSQLSPDESSRVRYTKVISGKQLILDKVNPVESVESDESEESNESDESVESEESVESSGVRRVR